MSSGLWFKPHIAWKINFKTYSNPTQDSLLTLLPCRRKTTARTHTWGKCPPPDFHALLCGPQTCTPWMKSEISPSDPGRAPPPGRARAAECQSLSPVSFPQCSGAGPSSLRRAGGRGGEPPGQQTAVPGRSASLGRRGPFGPVSPPAGQAGAAAPTKATGRSRLLAPHGSGPPPPAVTPPTGVLARRSTAPPNTCDHRRKKRSWRGPSPRPPEVPKPRLLLSSEPVV